MKNKTISGKSVFLLLGANLIITFLIVIALLFVFIPRAAAATGCFPDTNGHWAETFICWMSDNSLTGGYPDGTYKPENNVTRAEMAVFMKNSYDLVSGEDDDTLGSLSCTTDQIAKWNGSTWVCATDLDTDTDTLGSLSCTTDQIAKWNGSVWVCDSSLADLVTMLASISLENGGDDLVFTGVNVHVRSGSGATNGTINGLGNLIVGYNEDTFEVETRTGSHNLVLGYNNDYTSYGGLVAGEENTITGAYASVSGGYQNIASGFYSSVSGGYDGSVSGPYDWRAGDLFQNQ